MKDLPPEAASLLERARVAHEPTSKELARSLAKLHASLEFASEVTSSPPGGPAVHDALLVRGGLLATRAAKGALLTVVLGAAVGSGWLWFRAPPDSATGSPSGAPTAPTAPAPEVSPAAASLHARTDRPRSPSEAGKPVADVLNRPSQLAGAPAPGAAIELPAGRTAVVIRPGVSTDKRAPSSRSVLARFRTAREYAPGPSASAVPLESTSISVVPSPPPANDRAATSSSDSRSSRTHAPPWPSELELIDGALRSLRDHDPKRSLAVLARHAELYPDGKLATERRGLSVLALCAAGERVRAAHERAAYLADDPHTPMAERVRRTCRPEGEP